ncbi:uncharacterized protein [Narcine bancroftii]|uniref:uncharacterized protein n=1 Tax=Narcine bancroftii TaxID=1343680 RepID=UPI003831762A
MRKSETQAPKKAATKQLIAMEESWPTSQMEPPDSISLQPRLQHQSRGKVYTTQAPTLQATAREDQLRMREVTRMRVTFETAQAAGGPDLPQSSDPGLMGEGIHNRSRADVTSLSMEEEENIVGLEEEGEQQQMEEETFYLRIGRTLLSLSLIITIQIYLQLLICPNKWKIWLYNIAAMNVASQDYSSFCCSRDSSTNLSLSMSGNRRTLDCGPSPQCTVGCTKAQCILQHMLLQPGMNQ